MLTDREKEILTFQGEWPGGSMEAVTRRKFGVPHIRYVQELHAALDNPAALEWDPMLVRRLNRLRYRRAIRRRLPYGASATRSATPIR
jgi:hypothetical protein